MSSDVVVTRAGQITLTRDVREKMGVREGDVIVVNTIGNQALITKRDPSIFERTPSFLPKNFPELLKKMRAPNDARLKRLGIIP